MLKIEHLCKSFGGLAATSDVSLHFPPGSLSAVIGPNGAGKTTFFNLISGAIRPDSGRILFDGEDIAGKSRSGIVRRGIGRAFQVASIFPSLTVEEALMGALHAHREQSAIVRRRFPMPGTQARAREVMDMLGLAAKAKTLSLKPFPPRSKKTS